MSIMIEKLDIVNSKDMAELLNSNQKLHFALSPNKPHAKITGKEYYFRGWGPYAGLQLETDWKSKIRKTCDITFRALLILHYSDLTKKDDSYEIFEID